MKPGVTLDVWQHDLCSRLEKAFWLARADFFKFKEVNIGAGLPYVEAPSGFRIDLTEFEEERGKGMRAAIHAPPQFGKSIIISQCYPAWILGYEPTHRFRLATYNISHSKAFSEVVLNIIRSPEHTAIFTDPAGHVPPRVSTVKWYTNARRLVNDGQSSFTALGLQSGFVGTGADTLLEDDPYKSIDEALSEVIRDKTWRFNTDTAFPRLGESSNVFIMFHRYHQDDCGGRAIATGTFDLWRYAAEADGDYVDEETGLVYADPLMRAEGAPLSDRFPAAYYARQKQNSQVWFSQFQGRPTSKTGGFFNVSLIKEIRPEDVPRLVHRGRGWDNAYTSGGGDYTVGVLMGMDAAENVYIEDVERGQVGTAERELMQRSAAERDGKLVTITHPQDPAAGKEIAFNFQQKFHDYNVVLMPTRGSKEKRCYNFSKAVNSGKCYVVLKRDGSRPDWYKPYKEVLKNFPVGTYDDDADASGDVYDHLYKLFHRGLVIKSYDERASLVPWPLFSKRFGEKIPKGWEVSAALRVSADSSLPSGWAILARASEYAQIGEAVFLVASARLYAREPGEVIAGLKAALTAYCELGPEHAQAIWLGRDSEDVIQLAAEKYGLGLARFTDGADAGLAETNWYFQPVSGKRQPFTGADSSPHLFMLADASQIDSPVNERGLLSTRQEVTSWSYNDHGEAQPYGGVTLDCVRMPLYNFALQASPMTKEQRRETLLPEHLREDAIRKSVGTKDFVDNYWAREHALGQQKRQEEKEQLEEKKKWGQVFGMPAQHRRYRK